MSKTFHLVLALASAASLWLPVPIPTIAGGESTANSANEPRRLLVRLRPSVPETIVDPTLSAVGADLERSLRQIGVLVVSVPEGKLDRALAALRGHPAVEEVQHEIGVSALDTNPNDVHWPGQWGLQRARFAKAWDVARGSQRTVIGVIDTGVERSHPDLRGAVLPGYDFVDDDAEPSDEHGHGTAVAGILAARGNNRTGIAGSCWGCRILPVRVLARDGGSASGRLAAGIIWAVDHGAKVINLSLGAERTSMAIDGAIDYAARHDVVLVAAAGNEGSAKRFYPAASRRVIAVAGTDPADRFYPWSNRGDWIDISAPGCNTSLWRGESYATFCGTSSAAPLVAGFAALIRSAHPRASAAETERMLGGSRLDASVAFPKSSHPRPKRARRHELVDFVRKSHRTF